VTPDLTELLLGAAVDEEFSHACPCCP